LESTKISQLQNRKFHNIVTKICMLREERKESLSPR